MKFVISLCSYENYFVFLLSSTLKTFGIRGLLDFRLQIWLMQLQSMNPHTKTRGDLDCSRNPLVLGFLGSLDLCMSVGVLACGSRKRGADVTYSSIH